MTPRQSAQTARKKAAKKTPPSPRKPKTESVADAAKRQNAPKRRNAPKREDPALAPEAAEAAALAIFVKTPGISPIKTRLAADIGDAAAAAVYRQSLRATAAVVRAAVVRSAIDDRAATRRKIAPFWAVGDSGISQWRGFATVPTGGGGLGTRLWRVYRRLRASHRTVILIGADSPQLPPAAIVRAAALAADNALVVGPAADGGFYLFAAAFSISRRLWESVAYSGDDTLSQLLARLREKNPRLKIIRLKQETDIDDAASLARAAAALQNAPLPEQRRIAPLFKAAAPRR